MPRNNSVASQVPASSSASVPDANKPVERFHEGSVHVSIWEKSGPKGSFRTASFQLRYRDEEEWRTSTSYGLGDIANLEKAAREAHARISSWQREARNQENPELKR
jgi:hypothetical protein